MKFAALLEHLRNPTLATRKDLWKLLPETHTKQPFSRAQIRELQKVLAKESDLDVRTIGIIALDQILHMPVPEPDRFFNWLFHSFRSRGGADTARSLVLTVRDDENFRDVQALVEVARYLDSERYAQTEFRHVSQHSPDWADIRWDAINSICFIGRPSMFRDCPIINRFPADLRFSIEPPDSDAPGDFHRVCQKREKAGKLIYPTTQDESHRHDHAIVQRFVISHLGTRKTIIVIAGGSSLGTVGAAQWLTSKYMYDAERRSDLARVAGQEPDWTTRVEVLLSVSATIERPARPWRPIVDDAALFLNSSRNLLREPNRIAVATQTGQLKSAEDVKYLLFDDDELRLSEADYAAAVALCVKYCLDHHPSMPIAEFQTDKRLWLNEKWPVGRDLVAFFRDHLQRHSFNGILEVPADSLNLKLENRRIEVVRAG
jgi:hypothetical protein